MNRNRIKILLQNCLMRNTLACIGASVLTICFSPVSAQEYTELDPVTITNAIRPEKTSQTGRNLFVIRGDRFADLPVHSVDELLRYLPGIEMQSRGPLGAQSDVVIRGGTFQQALVILDGVRLNDPNTGHFSAYIPIAPSEIERIEILKGASSAIYGSEAVGGVIHIITKSYAAKKGTAASQIQGQIAGGQYDLLSVSAGAFYTDGRTSVGGGILSNNTSGQQQRGTRGSVYANTASLSMGHKFNDQWQFNMRYAYDKRNFSAQNFYTNFVSDTAQEKVTTFWSQYALSYTRNRHRLNLSIGYKDLEDEYQFNSVGIPNMSRSNLTQVLLTDDWKLSDRSVLVSGGQFIRKKIRSNDRGRHTVDAAAGFMMLNQRFGNHFAVSPAMRLEWNENAGWEWVPQLNLSYQKSKYQLRASAGKTIRDADFTERFNNYNKAFVASGRIGNPDLEAETSISYEAGADFFAGKNLRFSGTFFQRFHRKLIDYVPTDYDDMPRKDNLTPGGSYALAKNVSKVTTSGAEADIQYAKDLPGGQRLWFNLGFIWLESNSSDSVPSFYISSHAQVFTNFNVIYTYKRFSLSANGIYKHRQAQTATVPIAKVSPDYFVLNLKAEAMIAKNMLSVFVEGDNIFDTDYADLLGSQMPGRWLMGGIKITLSK